MVIGLLSTVTAVFYGTTVMVLALTATFARSHTLRREARSTLAVLVPGRMADSQYEQQADPHQIEGSSSTRPPNQ